MSGDSPLLHSDWGLAQRCVADRCQRSRFEDMPVCFAHAYLIFRRVEVILDEDVLATRPRSKHPVVYYLMLSATKVKIGTTSDLLTRLTQHRSKLQYVVALEQGSYDLEAQRHREFADDRVSRLEEFELSPSLEAHIRHLQMHTYSDELLDMYRDRLTRRMASRVA